MASPEIVIDISPSEREQRGIKLGDQNLTFNSPAGNVLEAKARAAVSIIEGIKIDGTPMLMVADDELRRLKGTKQALDKMRESVSKPLHQAWEANNAVYREPIRIIDDGIRRLTAAISDYHAEVQRKAEIARRQAEEQAEAERRRLAEEARVAEEQAAQSAMLGDEAEAEASFAAAEELEMESQLVTAAVVEVEDTRISGTSVSYRYGAEPPTSNADKVAALQFILKNQQFLNLVDFSRPAANQLAVALKDNFSIPGFKLEKKPVISQRGVKPSNL